MGIEQPINAEDFEGIRQWLEMRALRAGGSEEELTCRGGDISLDGGFPFARQVRWRRESGEENDVRSVAGVVSGICEGWGVKTGVREMNFGVEGVGRGLVRLRGEESEELVVDVDSKGAQGKDVASEVKFTIVEFGQEEWRIDVGLDDEVTKVRGYDARSRCLGWDIGLKRWWI